MRKLLIFLFTLISSQVLAQSSYSALVYPNQAECLQRSQQQCQVLGCDGVRTVYWWSCIGPFLGGTAGQDTITVGSYGLVVQPSGPFGATTSNNVSNGVQGLTAQEQTQLVAGTAVASLLYAGPCDSTFCAEAFSVTRAMISSYNGPLFQLYNGTSTLDIGQTSAHMANVSAATAFCGNLGSACVYSKIYGQISGNVLVPSTVNGSSGPLCAGQGNYICAAPFSVEAATGLPILITATPQEYYNGVIGGDDTIANGITAGSGPMSVVYNGINVQSGFCCGIFGLYHKYNAGNAAGTDFGLALVYGQAGISPCATSTTYCLVIDEEGPSDAADYGSTIMNVIAAITFDPTNKTTVTGTVNGHLLFSNSPPVQIINSGAFIHLGGGGDLSQPAPAKMREGIITNSTLTAAQISAIQQNMMAFYSALSFSALAAKQ